jgi:hypothetical protein
VKYLVPFYTTPTMNFMMPSAIPKDGGSRKEMESELEVGGAGKLLLIISSEKIHVTRCKLGSVL